MKIPKIKNGIEKFSDSALVEYASFIHQQISSRPATFASPTPGMVVYKTAIDDFQALMNVATGGDRVLIGQKNVLRNALELHTHVLSYYVMLTAQGNAQVILESGFQMVGPSQSSVLTKPSDLRVTNGEQSGELLLKVKKVPGAASYSYQYSTDPAMKEESWKIENCTSSRCKLIGLTPGTTYYVRVGAIGTKGQVMFSDAASRIAA
jgi:hypothetical protein